LRESNFQTELRLRRKPEEVFGFFCDVCNLQTITPAWLDFRVLTTLPIEMKTGARIDYRLRVHGLPMRWQSEITIWEPPHRFVDEQRRGPYRLWIHEHRFESNAEGTLCKDFVRYAVPGGRLMEWLFVRRDIERIFAFRRKKLLEIFS
jgi:ligand-binding SRPBCC domain-containing protein